MKNKILSLFFFLEVPSSLNSRVIYIKKYSKLTYSRPFFFFFLKELVSFYAYSSFCPELARLFHRDDSPHSLGGWDITTWQLTAECSSRNFPSQVTPCPGNSSIHRPVNWGKMALTVGLNLGHLRGASAAPERPTASAEAPQCTYPSSTALCPVSLPSLHRGCSWENVQGAVYVETSALVSSSLGTQQKILPDHQNVSCFKLNRP